jgi:hypothetical protein
MDYPRALSTDIAVKVLKEVPEKDRALIPLTRPYTWNFILQVNDLVPQMKKLIPEKDWEIVINQVKDRYAVTPLGAYVHRLPKDAKMDREVVDALLPKSLEGAARALRLLKTDLQGEERKSNHIDEVVAMASSLRKGFKLDLSTQPEHPRRDGSTRRKRF